MTNMETDLPYLERDKDRHGNPRIYVRRNGKRVRIREQEGTLEFAKAVCGGAGEAMRGIACQGSPAPDDAPKGHAGLYGGKILRLERV